MRALWLSRSYTKEFYHDVRNFVDTLKNFIDIDIIWHGVDTEFMSNYDIIFLHNLWMYSDIQWKDVRGIKCLIAVDGQYTEPSSFYRKNMSYKILKIAVEYFDYAFVRHPLAWKKLWPNSNFKDTFFFPPCVDTNIIKVIFFK